MSTYDVAVVGRGAIGSAAALAFARAGRRVALVGPARPRTTSPVPAAAPLPRPAVAADDWDQRVYALSPASRALLAELGVWQLLDPARLAPVHDMRIFQQGWGTPGKPPPEVHLAAYEGRVEALAWIIENRKLQAALDLAIAALPAATGLVRVDAEVESLVLPLTPQDRTPAMLVLSGGGKLSADLVIAADGTTSRLRDLAGVEHRVRDYRQTAIVANFEAERSHRDCAWQWFGDFGVVALLPLPGKDLRHGRSRVSLVWSAASEEAAAALRQPAELPALVQSMTSNRLGALHPITPPAAFVLRAVRCREVIKPSFILIGDAAHAIHPMAGQGMNLGFGDVRGLIEHLMDSSGTLRAPVRPPDWFDLRRYERSRREPVMAMQLALDGLHRAFGNIPVPLAGLRDLGWSIVAGSSWLRRRMIEHAVS